MIWDANRDSKGCKFTSLKSFKAAISKEKTRLKKIRALIEEEGGTRSQPLQVVDLLPDAACLDDNDDKTKGGEEDDDEEEGSSAAEDEEEEGERNLPSNPISSLHRLQNKIERIESSVLWILWMALLACVEEAITNFRHFLAFIKASNPSSSCTNSLITLLVGFGVCYCRETFFSPILMLILSTAYMLLSQIDSILPSSLTANWTIIIVCSTLSSMATGVVILVVLQTASNRTAAAVAAAAAPAALPSLYSLSHNVRKRPSTNKRRSYNAVRDGRFKVQEYGTPIKSLEQHHLHFAGVGAQSTPITPPSEALEDHNIGAAKGKDSSPRKRREEEEAEKRTEESTDDDAEEVREGKQGPVALAAALTPGEV